MAGDGHPSGHSEPYREQTIEIALGPKSSFENGNVGVLRLRAPPSQIVSAVPPGSPKPARVTKIPPVVELLRKAIEWKSLLESGKIANQVEIACMEGITCARVSQVLGMLRLAPEIQKRVLSLPVSVRRTAITERLLRPITGITDHRDQIQEYYKLLKQAAISLKPRSPAEFCC